MSVQWMESKEPHSRGAGQSLLCWAPGCQALPAPDFHVCHFPLGSADDHLVPLVQTGDGESPPYCTPFLGFKEPSPQVYRLLWPSALGLSPWCLHICLSRLQVQWWQQLSWKPSRQGWDISKGDGLAWQLVNVGCGCFAKREINSWLWKPDEPDVLSLFKKKKDSLLFIKEWVLRDQSPALTVSFQGEAFARLF